MATTTTIKVNGIDVPVRFSMVGMLQYLDSKGKRLEDLSSLSFLEILDICWIAVRTGYRRAGQENPFKSEDDFFDAIDDDTAAIERFTAAMNHSLEDSKKDDAKNAKPQAKRKV
jgi:hypothetical protein